MTEPLHLSLRTFGYASSARSLPVTEFLILECRPVDAEERVRNWLDANGFVERHGIVVDGDAFCVLFGYLSGRQRATLPADVARGCALEFARFRVGRVDPMRQSPLRVALTSASPRLRWMDSEIDELRWVMDQFIDDVGENWTLDYVASLGPANQENFAALSSFPFSLGIVGGCTDGATELLSRAGWPDGRVLVVGVFSNDESFPIGAWLDRLHDLKRRASLSGRFSPPYRLGTMLFHGGAGVDGSVADNVLTQAYVDSQSIEWAD
jgi:hypothetical protein